MLLKKHLFLIVLVFLLFSTNMHLRAQPFPSIGIGFGISIPTGNDIKSTFDQGYFINLDSKFFLLMNDISLGPSFIYKNYSNIVNPSINEELNIYLLGVQANYFIPISSSSSLTMFPFLAIYYGSTIDGYENDQGNSHEIFTSKGVVYNFGIGFDYHSFGIEISYLINNNNAVPSSSVIDDLISNGVIIKETAFSMSSFMMSLKYNLNIF